MTVVYPFAIYNYAHEDLILRPSAQLIGNVFIVFASGTIVHRLFVLRAQSQNAFVLQMIAIFGLSLSGILISTTFTTICMLNELGMISDSSSRQMGMPAISTLCTIASTVLAWAKFRVERLSEEFTGRIILPGG